MDFPSLHPQNYQGLLAPNANVESVAPDAPPAATTDAAVASGGKTPGFLERLVNRLEDAYWRQIIKSREAYLAKAQNTAELENRMKQLDSDSAIRWRPTY